MKYKLFAGGVDYLQSPISLKIPNKIVLDKYNELPKINVLPMFNDENIIKEVFADKPFCFKNDTFHCFAVTCTQPKYKQAIGTNLIFSIVPEHLATNATNDTILPGRIDLHGLDRAISLNFMNITIDISTDSNHAFLSALNSQIKKHIKSINNKLKKHNTTFDMIVTDPKTAKRDEYLHEGKGVAMTLNGKGIESKFRTENHSLGVFTYTKTSPILMCDLDALKALGSTPNYFLEHHPAFHGTKNMQLGTEKRIK